MNTEEKSSSVAPSADSAPVNGNTIDGQSPSPPSPSSDELIRAAQEETKVQQNKYLYLYAEFETYKKRVLKERADLLKFGNESFVRELLMVADNLDRALEHSDVHNALIDGIKLVRQQLRDTFLKFNVEPVKSIGEKFNPERHEAVGQESSSLVEEGVVLREHQAGYLLHGRLLRPARVIIATK